MEDVSQLNLYMRSDRLDPRKLCSNVSRTAAKTLPQPINIQCEVRPLPYLMMTDKNLASPLCYECAVIRGRVGTVDGEVLDWT